MLNFGLRDRTSRSVIFAVEERVGVTCHISFLKSYILYNTNSTVITTNHSSSTASHINGKWNKHVGVTKEFLLLRVTLFASAVTQPV